jgi:tetratricopeptide (TPR) repeat protein
MTNDKGLGGNFDKDIASIRLLMKFERFTQAAQQASRLLFLDPTQRKAYYYRAIAYAQMCDIHSAILDMQRVIELEPLNAKAAAWCASLNFSEGLLVLKKKQYAVALKHFLKASQYDRKSINSRLFAALSHVALGQYPDAVSVLLEAKKTMHHPYIDAILANLSLHFDQLAEAYHQANESLSVDPHNPIALKVIEEIKTFVDRKMSMVDEMLMSDKREAALLEINSLLEIRPDLVPIRVHKAMIMRSAGNLAEAERELIDILDAQPNVEAQRQLALTYNDMGIGVFMNGEAKEAIAWFDAAMRESADDPNFYINKGDCYRALGDFETAIANYHHAVECGASGDTIQQRIAITHYSIARNALKKGNSKAALFELDKAIDASRSFPDFFIVRAKVRVSLGQFEESLADLFAVLEIDPENAEAKRLLNVTGPAPKATVKKPARPATKRKVGPEIRPYSIDDLRANPFDFISGLKRLPK